MKRSDILPQQLQPRCPRLCVGAAQAGTCPAQRKTEVSVEGRTTQHRWCSRSSHSRVGALIAAIFGQGSRPREARCAVLRATPVARRETEGASGSLHRDLCDRPCGAVEACTEASEIPSSRRESLMGGGGQVRSSVRRIGGRGLDVELLTRRGRAVRWTRLEPRGVGSLRVAPVYAGDVLRGHRQGDIQCESRRDDRPASSSLVVITARAGNRRRADVPRRSAERVDCANLLIPVGAR